jgi:hypothetical protein
MGLTTIRAAGDFESYIRRRLGYLVRDFRLVVAAEGVVLRGRARTYYAKQLAQQTTMQATALPILANDIDVSPTRQLATESEDDDEPNQPCRV